MKYIRKFTEHSVYDANKNELVYPSVSYCVKENEVHYGSNVGNIRFYVGDLSGKTNQTVVINYSGGTHDTVSIQEPNKWYSHNIPSGKALSSVTNLDYIKEAVVNCDKAYAQDWKKVGKVSYFNCDILGDRFASSYFTSLDLRTVDTNNVTSMYYMFSGCIGLTSLDVSNFNTSNVTDMEGMFYGCSGLTSLDVSNFNTSNVKFMNNMFERCSGLTSLDLSNFNTSNVTNFGSMFRYCSGLISLDLRGCKVRNTQFTFDGCSNLASLDLSGWDMSKVTSLSDIYGMFGGCYKLTTITMKGCTQDTINMIKEQLTRDKITGVAIITE